MKRQYNFLSIILAAGLLTACSSDEPGPLPESVPAAFSAQIGQSVSRASGTQWDAGDAIGISCMSGDKTYSNVKFVTAASDGNFSADGDNIYYQTADPVTFTAYYPYADAFGSEGIITASTADQSQQPAFDFLWAQASGNYASPGVHFTFAHRMAQLNIAFTNGNDVDLSDLTFGIEGLVLDGTFDTVTGEAKAAANGTSASLTAALTSESKASLILFPQIADNLTVTANAEGQTFECKMSLGELKAGCSYRVNITVSKTEMTVTGCTIIPWGDGGSTDTEMDPLVHIGDKKPVEAAVGDFYMNDGSLVDNAATLTDEQKAACIGIVFTTDPDRIGEGAKSALTAKGVSPHGLVMALTNATSENHHWSNISINEPGLAETDNLQKMYQNVDGYAETHQIIDNRDALQSDYTAFYFVSRYCMAGSDTEKYAAPEKSTGCFMPSIGQWWDIMRNLGGISALDNYKDNTTDFLIRLDNQGSTARNNINASLSKIPGASTIGQYDCFWTSSEFNENRAVGVSFVGDGSFYFIYNYKNMQIYDVRCVLAF